ncbi:MAG: hypothetical protein M0D57_00800 [Sphingobacteriales bacterium JAD_PAG50586_3]|nr:MAG: hypothetical protein M0D57_00800 [Sphingobacteriales bacterium JAD_PAG50586_3]
MRILLLLLILPFALSAQLKPRILVVPPHAVQLNSNVAKVLAANNITPAQWVDRARATFAKLAKPDLEDFDVYVTGVDDTLHLKPTLTTRTAKVKFKRRNFITKKEKLVTKKVKYKGVQISPEDKLVLDGLATKQAYDFVIFVSFFEVTGHKGLNLAFKPLSSFAIHYEVYDSRQTFITGNIVQDALAVSPGMQIGVLNHYLNLSAENVYRNVASVIANGRRN